MSRRKLFWDGDCVCYCPDGGFVATNVIDSRGRRYELQWHVDTPGYGYDELCWDDWYDNNPDNLPVANDADWALLIDHDHWIHPDTVIMIDTSWWMSIDIVPSNCDIICVPDYDVVANRDRWAVLADQIRQYWKDIEESI